MNQASSHNFPAIANVVPTRSEIAVAAERWKLLVMWVSLSSLCLLSNKQKTKNKINVFPRCMLRQITIIIFFYPFLFLYCSIIVVASKLIVKILICEGQSNVLKNWRLFKSFFIFSHHQTKQTKTWTNPAQTRALFIRNSHKFCVNSINEFPDLRKKKKRICGFFFPCCKATQCGVCLWGVEGKKKKKDSSSLNAVLICSESFSWHNFFVHTREEDQLIWFAHGDDWRPGGKSCRVKKRFYFYIFVETQWVISGKRVCHFCRKPFTTLRRFDCSWFLQKTKKNVLMRRFVQFIEFCFS